MSGMFNPIIFYPASVMLILFAVLTIKGKKYLKFNSLIAICLAVSVFPTPVAPTNKNTPSGLLISLMPNSIYLIWLHIDLIAVCWPSKDLFKLSSKVLALFVISILTL